MAYKESIAPAAVKAQLELQNPLRKQILLFNVYNIKKLLPIPILGQFNPKLPN
jgi:hypothetical protein